MVPVLKIVTLDCDNLVLPPRLSNGDKQFRGLQQVNELDCGNGGVVRGQAQGRASPRQLEAAHPNSESCMSRRFDSIRAFEENTTASLQHHTTDLAHHGPQIEKRRLERQAAICGGRSRGPSSGRGEFLRQNDPPLRHTKLAVGTRGSLRDALQSLYARTSSGTSTSSP